MSSSDYALKFSIKQGDIPYNGISLFQHSSFTWHIFKQNYNMKTIIISLTVLFAVVALVVSDFMDFEKGHLLILEY